MSGYDVSCSLSAPDSIWVLKQIIHLKACPKSWLQFSSQPDYIGVIQNKSKFVHGGATVLNCMVECPVKAALTARIGVKNHAPNYVSGFTAVEKGQAAIQALQSVWAHIIAYKELQGLSSDHAALLHIAKNELQEAVESAVDEAFFWLDREDIGYDLMASEKVLLAKCIVQWLALERERSPFNIDTLAGTGYLTLGKYKLKVGHSRVDTLAAGANNNIKLAFKFKSSENLVSSAFSTTPMYDLPLTAISTDADAVAYLNVKINDPSISGIGELEDHAGFINAGDHRYKAPKQWPNIKQYWHEQMTQVLNAYVNGVLKFNPSRNACMHCVKKSLCEHAAI